MKKKPEFRITWKIPYYKAGINEYRFSISIIDIDYEITYLFLN